MLKKKIPWKTSTSTTSECFEKEKQGFGNQIYLFSIEICVQNNEASTKQTGFKRKIWYGFRTGSNSGCSVGNIRKKIYNEVKH